MEDAKLQVLHDTLSQIRGKKGLGTSAQFSWQRGAGASQAETTRHPSAIHLPDNALYAHFLPEGVYDPASKTIDYGDGRIIKRDFSDAIIDADNGDDATTQNKERKRKVDKEEKARQKEIRKAEKKAAKKGEKLKAKREAKLEEKKRQKKLEKIIKKEQSSEVVSRTPAQQLDFSQNKNIAETKSNNKHHMIDINKEVEHDGKKVAKKRKKAKIAMS